MGREDRRDRQRPRALPDVLALATSWIPGVDVITAALAEADNLIALVGTGMADRRRRHAGPLGRRADGRRHARPAPSSAAKPSARSAARPANSAEKPRRAPRERIGAEARAAEGGKTADCERDPIDVVSGWMLTDETDLALPGALPVVLRRAYASGYTTGRLFGPGWSCTLDQRISVNAAGIHFAGDDAQRSGFPIPASAEEVLPDARPPAPLVWDRGLDEIRITDPDTGYTPHFAVVHYRDEIGEIRDLTAITDRNGNRIAIARAQGTPALVSIPAIASRSTPSSTEAGPGVSAISLADGDRPAPSSSSSTTTSVDASPKW